MDNGRVPKPSVNLDTVLRVSEHFLRREHYSDCRRYAQQVYEIDPTFPGVSEILAVADVLSSPTISHSTGTLHDWYAVMQLDRFSPDSDLITQRFNRLYELLNPSNNKFPFADKAFDLVCEAWYVLSNPEKRREFDESLTRATSGAAFWTVCPYCYYVYEYPRVFLELCLKCANEKCSKAFTCMEIDRPPVEVLIEGKYICAGFSPLGFQYGNWNPFAASKKQEAKPIPDTFVQISDDDEDEDETNRKENDKETGKEVARRKKSVAKHTKKVTGVGNRVTKEDFVHREETDPTTKSPGNDGDCRLNSSFEFVGDVEFDDDGDGDILVRLQSDF